MTKMSCGRSCDLCLCTGCALPCANCRLSRCPKLSIDDLLQRGVVLGVDSWLATMLGDKPGVGQS